MDLKGVVFCTYFDKGFLLKGLALHKSLIKYNPDAKLWILAFDKYTEKILKKMKLKGVTVVSLTEFEDKELLGVKPTRQTVEYYWTCTPSLPLYVLNKNKDANYVLYLDADLYFYSEPKELLDEIKDNSLLVVEHRFPKGMESIAERNGRFNVAVNVFKRDSEGIKCLKRWRNQCIDWCYYRAEEGKMGDQKYLDEWPKLYKNLIISKNLGVDAAPWNIAQYHITKRDSKAFINGDKLICYHFHQFQILGPDHFSRVMGYTLPKEAIEFIYKPYEEEIRKQYKKVKSIDSSFEIKTPDQNGVQVARQSLAKYIGPIYWRLQGFLKKLSA